MSYVVCGSINSTVHLLYCSNYLCSRRYVGGDEEGEREGQLHYQKFQKNRNVNQCSSPVPVPHHQQRLKPS